MPVTCRQQRTQRQPTQFGSLLSHCSQQAVSNAINTRNTVLHCADCFIKSLPICLWTQTLLTSRSHAPARARLGVLLRSKEQALGSRMMAQACSGRCGTPMLRTQAAANAFVVSRQHQHSRALVNGFIDNCNSPASCSKGLHQASHQPGPCSSGLGPCWRLRQRGCTLRPASASFNGLLPSAPSGEPSSQAHAAGSASAAAGQPQYGEFRAPQELQSLVNAIPFRRLAIWLFVGLVAWQLSDFFGVRGAAWEGVGALPLPARTLFLHAGALLHPTCCCTLPCPRSWPW